MWVENCVGLKVPGLRYLPGRAHGFMDLTDRPMNAVTTKPVMIVIEDTPGESKMQQSDKPPYRIPLMREISQIPHNGFNAVSTFSGCGGSSLGYRMAGFKVLWASEFIPAARETYKANAAPYTILDPRDIRQVTPEDILSAINMRPGELDLLDGSPPCSSFSTAGKRHKGWGEVKKYSDTKQRTDDLFFEFIRILKGLQPKTFVAENVSGLVKGSAKGLFKEILSALKGCGYRVSAKVLDAQWLGVPQARQRLIFVGVRSDLGLEPVHPKPLPYRYALRDVLPVLSSTIENECDISGYAIGKEWDKMAKPGTQSEKYFQLVRPDPDKPCPTVTQTAGITGAAGVTHPTERRKFSIAELKRICGFPDDFKVTGSYAQQ
jgi:DNA (cytosine-5)-methyltransferase 1